jgi:DNA-binding winged helix-turn-helix (wHTH) protein/tetratricopeptide (TPR) repeat protein
MDTVNQCLWRRGNDAEDQRILMTPKAFAVLRFLVEHAGRLVTHDELLEALWPATYVQPEVLKSHIRDIRDALGDDPKKPLFVETLPRRGYRFIAPLSERFPDRDLDGASSAPRLIGRSVAMSRLQGTLQRTLRGERQVVFVTGEAGIGKTALVDVFQRQAGTENSALRIARGQCVEGYGGQEPYYPMLEALGHLCRGEGQESVVQILATQAPTWLVQFPALVNREQREKLQRELLGAGRERMLREIADALETISLETPLLLVFEDLHWVDHSTVDLIAALARRRRPAKLQIIGTYRPVDVLVSEHPLKGLKQDLLVHHLCQEVALEPLSEVEVAEYLAAESSNASIPEGLAALLYRHSEGNPLFMLAALEHLREQNLVTQENGSWRTSHPIDEIDIQAPESLRDEIEGQIARLREEEQRALEAASIVGISFSVAVAATAANLSAEEFEKVCERLSRRHQIIRALESNRFADGDDSQRYEFVHSLFREALYRRQSSGRRSRLHRQIGHRLEALCARPELEAAAELANHFEQGGDWVRSIQYLTVAAITAGKRFEPRQAAKLLEHALELIGKLPEESRSVIEIDILEKLGAIYVALFETRAIRVYQSIIDRASQDGLIEVEVRALLSMALPSAWNSADAFLDCVERALRLSDRLNPSARERLRATCLLWRLGAKWTQSDADECEKKYWEIRRSEDRLTLLSLVEWSYFLFNSSQYREALRCAVQSYEALMKESEQNPFLTSTFLLYQNIIPKIHLFLGDLGSALKEADAMVATVAKNGNVELADWLWLNRVPIHLCAMDFEGAARICESASKVPMWASAKRLCQNLAGQADIGRGSYQTALEHFEAVRRDMESHSSMDDWFTRMALESGISDLWLLNGDLVQARIHAERFLSFAQTTAERTWRAMAFETNARVAAAEGNLQRAQDCIAQAATEMEEFEVPLAAWRVHSTASKIYAQLGRADLAEMHLESARATIMQLANSLLSEEPLRNIFLSAPAIRAILDGGTEDSVQHSN